jgi:hypothetical protein
MQGGVRASLGVNVEKLLEEKAPLINKAIERYIPRIFSKKAVIFKISPPRYAYNIEAINKALAEPIWEFLDRGRQKLASNLLPTYLRGFGKKSGRLCGLRHNPRSGAQWNPNDRRH